MSQYCIACNSSEASHLLNWGRFDIVLCKKCKLVYGTPLPTNEELTEYYSGFMFNKPESYEIRKQKAARRQEIAGLFNVASSGNSGRFLDYGGGTGLAYAAAVEMGFDVDYFDLDEHARAFTREQFKLDDEHDISRHSTIERKYDYIFSDNVIEHVPNPVNFLRDLLNALNKGGGLVVKTPHARNTETLFNPFIAFVYWKQAMKHNSFGKSLGAMLKRFWHCDPPRHIYSFSKESLINLMNQVDGDYNVAIKYYEVPPFKNTLNEAFFTRDKQYGIVKSLLIRLILLPILPVEWILQLFKFILLKTKIISSGGIILEVTKQ